MWGSDAPNEKVSGQMKWVLRAQQMEKDFAGQVFREEKQAQKTAPTAQASEPKGLFDGQYAENFYKALWQQGNTEHNLFKLGAGSVGGV
jgi:hypothetical protein